MTSSAFGAADKPTEIEWTAVAGDNSANGGLLATGVDAQPGGDLLGALQVLCV